MKYLCYLLAVAFGYGAFEAGFRAYQNYLEHPGTRGMTELAAGIGAAAFMLIFMVMIINATREKTPSQPQADTKTT
jgi:hypothetical protein